MTESKTTKAELPEEDELPFDAPPAPAADPLFEDDGAPDPLEPIAPEQPEDPAADDPMTDSAPLQVVEAVPAQPVPEAIESADTALAPEPALLAESAESEPEPDEAPVEAPIKAAPASDPAPEEPEAPADAAAVKAVDEPHSDIFGPEPWEQAPAAVPPVHVSAWADVGPARDEAEPEPERAPAPAAEPAPAYTRPAPGEATLEIKRPAYAAYFCYFFTLVLVVPSIAAVVIASKARGDAPPWLQSHYVYLIRTFWILLGAIGLSLLLLPFQIGILIAFGTFGWLTTRSFFGLVRLHRGEPIFNPQTWFV